ncbi:retrovirus-related pol polyprotein from transposon TNT 1-94, partial [Tanacetum coccineum]
QSNMVMSFHVSKLLWHNRLGHPADQVLSVLKKDLNISDNTSMPMCEGPYRVHSREVIPLGQKNTLAEYMILSGVDNHPPTLDKDLVSKDLWERVQLLMQGFAVPVFSPRDDPIAYFNKTMAFQTVVASSSNATSSGGNNAGGQARVVKCYNYQGEGHMARKCTQNKRPRNAAWYKDKAILVETREAG